MLTALEQVFRDEWSRVLAAVVGYLGDFELAEESVAEAFAVAARRWPAEGVPASPAAWLMTTARHRAIDRLRRDRVLAAKLRLLAATVPETTGPEATEAEVDETEIPDERLELIFTCCHPALAPEAQIALTLRAVAGLGTEEIASAFLVSAETMKRRLTRAKTKIRDAGIPFSVPAGDRLPDRLAVVLAVVYLIFNQGYTAPGQAGHLSTEAIRLGRVLASLLPDQPEPRGLLALMLLHDARRLARLAGSDGQDLVLLADQDRSRWDWRQIEEARQILDRIVDSRGPYLIQAAVASLQAADPVDWRQVAALYAELAELTGSPVVRLNGAVAIAEADGPAAALAIVDRLDLAGYPYWHSTRAELLRRLGRADEARAAYRDALALAVTEPERRFLRRRIAEG
ncbi:MAG TPA: sigma-70 family RNA polymerase sigma factor [Trebonia sp.]|nr:sigma-70 family RNA polymerase sigma factor [Trebonia sp.]